MRTAPTDLEFNISFALTIIFLLITFGLATGVLPTWHPQWSLRAVWLTALCAATLFFASVLAHELSHAMIGRLGGVDVRRITLFVFGGMAHRENEPPSWGAELRMAIAGPIVSFHRRCMSRGGCRRHRCTNRRGAIRSAEIAGTAEPARDSSALAWLGQHRPVMASGQSVFPVEDCGRFVGWVTLEDLRRSSPNSRPSRRVAETMRPAAKLPSVAPDQNVSEAGQLMQRHESHYVPVVDEGRLLGVLTQEDLAKWISLRSDPEQHQHQFTAARSKAADLHGSR